MAASAIRASFPRDSGMDHAMAFSREGYRYIGNI